MKPTKQDSSDALDEVSKIIASVTPEQRMRLLEDIYSIGHQDGGLEQIDKQIAAAQASDLEGYNL